MRGVLEAAIGPVIRRSTYRRWVHLILGGAVLVPFVLLVAMVVPSIMPGFIRAEPLAGHRRVAGAGQMTAGPADGQWLVSVRIPLRTIH